MGSLTYQSFLHKEINKEENKITKKQFAMFIQENDGYVEYKNDDLFPKGYYVNKSLSKCVDENDNPVENAISSLGSSVTITSNKTVYCSLYFDKNEMLEYLRSKDTSGSLSEDIVGDVYRYQGIYTDDIRNYICLGDNCCTTESCPADTNDDMYRIIGITDTGELKVIKKTALTEKVKWNNDYSADINWPQSLLFQQLNDSYYYSLNNNLKQFIVNDHSWLYGDTISRGNYNDDTIYKIESGNSEATFYKKTEVGIESQTEKWNKRIEAPLGLMYISDYLYAYKTSELDAGKPGNRENALNSWIHISHNQLTNIDEWTMSRYGFNTSDNLYYVWTIIASGGAFNDGVADSNVVRPTFYLTSDIELIGEGTISEPFEIDYEKTGVDIINSKPVNLSTEEFGGMYRYQGTKDEVNNNYICFGTNNREKCLNDSDHYLYRIIGITDTGEMKLIKKEALNDSIQWSTDNFADVKWPDTEIYKNLDEIYLDNESYVPKNDNGINWQEKMETKDWLYGDSAAFEASESIEKFYQATTGQIPTTHSVKVPTSRKGESNVMCQETDSGELLGVEVCRILESDVWESSVTNKVGLMYLYDYYFSHPESLSGANRMDNWLYLGNNDSRELSTTKENPPTFYEWTMNRYGYLIYADYYTPICIKDNGVDTAWGYAENYYSIRPVFYLTSDSKLKGNGTLKYPYVIEE